MVHLVGKHKLRGEEEGEGEDTAFTYLIKKKGARLREETREKQCSQKIYTK